MDTGLRRYGEKVGKSIKTLAPTRDLHPDESRGPFLMPCSCVADGYRLPPVWSVDLRNVLETRKAETHIAYRRATVGRSGGGGTNYFYKTNPIFRGNKPKMPEKRSQNEPNSSICFTPNRRARLRFGCRLAMQMKKTTNQNSRIGEKTQLDRFKEAARARDRRRSDGV